MAKLPDPEERPMSGRRWYDRIDGMGEAVEVSQALPPEIRNAIARNLNTAIDLCREGRRSALHPLTLGSSRVLGLHKASRRKRWYDPEEELRRAYTHMGSVPERWLEAYAERILSVSDTLRLTFPHLLLQPEPTSMAGSLPALAGSVEAILHHSYIRFEGDAEGGTRLYYTHDESGAKHRPLPPAYYRSRRPH